MARIVYSQPHEAHRRLMELGVSLEALVAAIEAGHTGRLLCTPNDPPFIPGTEGWRFVVRTLRERLLPLGWRKADPGNYSLVINDKRKINIVVASADKFVRSTGGDPRTNSLKGLYTEAAVARNNHQGEMFPETISEEIRTVAAILDYPTWILLIHITDEERKAELSLPNIIEDGIVTDWDERIFIPDSADGAGTAEESDSGDSDFDIPVRRKA